ncbi:hypothetical protein ACLBSJ_31940, partial [Klebsiella pneumoniae]|uniref:hypothetical protein n=1 Tax=Klebsiella pneumoniae TaxID=573 RepID=UPI003969A719
GHSVIVYLRSGADLVDFMRDKLSVYIENDEVVVKIIDTTSGGSATHHSGYDVNNFERTYGQTN